MEFAGFPLPASIFERYMLLDDRPSHPMQSFLEVDLQGELPVTALQDTLPAALARHPLLSSTIRWSRRTACDWHFSTSPPTIMLLSPGESPPPQPALNLEQAPGLRIWVRPGPSGLTVILLVHHAACDALGMLTFFMEWLLLATGNGHRLPEDSVAALPHREDLHQIPAAFSWRQRWRNIARYLLGKPPLPLALPDQHEKTTPDSSESAYDVVRFSAEEFEDLKQAARDDGASINDCLAAALFLTIRDWDHDYRSQPSRRPWRILVPVNRRPVDQPFFSACNLIGYKMLTRTAGDTESFPMLLKSIREEMAAVRKSPRGVHSFVKMLSRFDRLGLLKRTIQRYDCFATVILSNLGNLDRYYAPIAEQESGRLSLGDIQVRAIRCAPPRRPQTQITIVALTCGGELQLVSSRLGPGLNGPQTLEFLQRFRRTLLRAVRELPRSPVTRDRLEQERAEQ